MVAEQRAERGDEAAVVELLRVHFPPFGRNCRLVLLHNCCVCLVQSAVAIWQFRAVRHAGLPRQCVVVKRENAIATLSWPPLSSRMANRGVKGKGGFWVKR